MVEVGRLATRRQVRFVNHSFKSGITIAASLHALAAVPGGEMFEFCMSDSPLRHELTHERFEVKEGYVHVPEGPGLGVTVNEEIVARYRVD
jgi:L-alanine-DL-glutamate epimerase-like enolase superfamily enzyme